MLKKQNNLIKYFEFSNLSKFKNLSHGIFSRNGGRSKSPYNSLNIGFNVGDDKNDVYYNLDLILNIMNCKALISVNQIHSDIIVVLDSYKNIDFKLNGDAIITNLTDIILLIKTADCQPVMLYDPVCSIIANIHSGWKGSILNIIGKTVDKMQKIYSSKPENIYAGIGPSLGPCCAEFINYKKEIPKEFWKYKLPNNYFNFWEISFDQLCLSGVKPENIMISNICTACNTKDFYSYRKEKKTGRFASAILINSRVVNYIR